MLQINKNYVLDQNQKPIAVQIPSGKLNIQSWVFTTQLFQTRF
jgi:hypothetical protein